MAGTKAAFELFHSKVGGFCFTELFQGQTLKEEDQINCF
jgi:hypothetical protein